MIVFSKNLSTNKPLNLKNPKKFGKFFEEKNQKKFGKSSSRYKGVYKFFYTKNQSQNLHILL